MSFGPPWRRALCAAVPALSLLFIPGLLLLPSAAAEAATITVAGTPNGPGVVAVAADGQCSLIEAINNANAGIALPGAQPHPDCVQGDILGGADTIVLPASATFTLDNDSVPTPFAGDSMGNGSGFALGLSGLPPITSRITIEGNGSTITRAVMTGGAATANFRILSVTESSDGFTLNDATLSGGVTSGTSSAPGYGGGLYTINAPVTLNRVTVRDNYARINAGAGGGGGLFLGAGNSLLNRCAIINNRSDQDGGGVYAPNPLSLRQSTVSGNTAGRNGGGVIIGGSIEVSGSSIVANAASQGGGLLLQDFGSSAALRNTLIAVNSGGSAPNCLSRGGHVQASGVNLTDDATTTESPCGLTEQPDLVLRSSDPSGTIGALADNGGPTLTHALLPGSSAIDAVETADCDTAGDDATDQRGITRPIDGDGDGTASCDVGAFEAANLPIPVDLQAGSATEGQVAVVDDGLCSIIEAIQNANDTVTGQPNLDCLPGAPDPTVNDTIVLPANATFTLDNNSVPTPFDTLEPQFGNVTVGLSGLPGITSNITIQGNNSVIERAATTGADPTANFRILTVRSDGTLDLTDTTIRGGVTSGAADSEGSGGGLFNLGSAALERVTVSDNSARRSTDIAGGGVQNENNARLVIRNSLITGNRADASAGGGLGLISSGGSTEVSHSTLSGNSALIGGGLATGRETEANLFHLSIINNSASEEGGGLFLSFDSRFGDPPVVRNLLIAGNAAPASPNCSRLNGRVLAGQNLTNDNSAPTSRDCGLTEQPDLVLRSADPNGTLGDLADNGGPTMTHALLPGSSAIDAVDAADCDTAGADATDQRGVARPQGAACDVGAYETGSYDFGDAPDSYGTTLASGGAQHELTGLPDALVLGALTDAEADGQPSADAGLDDTNGVDDEDGITLPAILVAGASSDLVVVSPMGQSAVLDGWIDFDGNGSFDPTEKVADGLTLLGGSESFPDLISTPSTAAGGPSFARFRLTAGGIADPAGFANSGEVEDYPVQIAVPTLSIADASIAEGNSGTQNLSFTISLSDAVSSDVTVQVDTADDTATSADNDYVAQVAQVATITAGNTATTVNVVVNGDLKFEDDESFFVNLSNAVGAAITDAQAIGTITNDDAPPSVSLSLTGSPFAENGGVATITANLSNTSSSPVLVNLSFSGTANNPADYTPLNTQIMIAAGATSGNISLAANDDNIFEGDETVIVDIASVSGGTEDGVQQVTATLTDDDPPPTVSFVADSASFPEGSGTQSIAAFVLSSASTQDVQVFFAVTGGDANQFDYRIDTPSPVTIPAGSITATVMGEILDDSVIEPDEIVIVDITNVTGAGIGTPSRFTGTITDDGDPLFPNGSGGAMSARDAAILGMLLLVGMWWRRRIRTS